MSLVVALASLVCVVGVGALLGVGGYAIVRLARDAPVGPPTTESPQWRLDVAAARVGLEVVSGDPASSVRELGIRGRDELRARLRGQRAGHEVEVEIGPARGEGEVVWSSVDDQARSWRQGDASRPRWTRGLPRIAARLTVSGPFDVPPFEVTIRPRPGEVELADWRLAAMFEAPSTSDWRFAYVPETPRLGGLREASFGDVELDRALVLRTNDPALGARLAPLVRAMRDAFVAELRSGGAAAASLEITPFCPHVWGAAGHVSMSCPELFSMRAVSSVSIDALSAIARQHER
ncbi:MAG: hypothetical protein M3Y87_07605 [Myxococcota bacterium]|nr:hypothetical protein [Myxococcota bacterium]